MGFGGFSLPVADSGFPRRPDAPLTVGISECLLGAQVRYDASDARSSLPRDTLEGLFDYRGVCPEVGIGMGVPRPPVRLIRSTDARVRAVRVVDAALDYTAELDAFATQIAAKLDHLAGYIFMQNSPSCGLYRVKVQTLRAGQDSGAPVRDGRGIYAGTLVRRMPCLPVEESGRLFDPVLRDNFVSRVFAWAHWRKLCKHVERRNLIEFHRRYQYLLMAHSLSHYQQARGLLTSVAADNEADLAELARRYIGLFMEGLAIPASRSGHSNVLAHLQNHLRPGLDGP